ncbi:DUF72 domain-containing protein [Amycolatopsis sp. NPDC059657]|uniref:DUF72 domain-containing protein n=1 Tax=Amycolatopsis sp. NPDC059657 TaxID=3346899 RepID=UPI00366A7D64
MIRVGVSGWLYPPWRGTFYPQGLPHKEELPYLARQVNTVEINGTFYSLQRPASFQTWFTRTPDDFVFAVKGPRFITHMKQLRDTETPLANFFASGVLALKHKLGPVLWQLPPRLRFDPERLTEFFGLLPRTTRAAAALAKRHDEKLKTDPWLKPGPQRRLRHAVEVRHPSFESAECTALLREHDIALVFADTAGKFPNPREDTADFFYLRLHGDKELYASGYSDKALDDWAATIHERRHKDIYVYFDNDMKVKAPGDARTLAAKLNLGSWGVGGGG